MERDKIIEEMTTNGLCCIACEMCDETEENGKFVKAECLESGCTNNCSISKHVAEAFIDAGYRKIPDGAVVLTKEEYEELKQRPEKVHDEMDERMKEELAIEKRMGEKKAEKARKETAREILSELKTIVKSEYGTYNEKRSLDWNTGCDMGMGHLLWKIKEIVKEKYGTEVE